MKIINDAKMAFFSIFEHKKGTPVFEINVANIDNFDAG
ncbi:hypothetical protein AQPE_2796 [Aquipluma nitroreducens]|uniref:Uncharacterized protein n=1 Tax=Aquipluma nitroreducens TaxID=2010828 RepID=A0A5K7SAM3_9BACT|nr:hypothetical protein AQPE_2796 [Aquipluma nitroreducens]